MVEENRSRSVSHSKHVFLRTVAWPLSKINSRIFQSELAFFGPTTSDSGCHDVVKGLIHVGLDWTIDV